jgi:hypothetical protein
MSNIFSYLNHTDGTIPMNTGVGALVSPVSSQHLNLDATGAVYSVLNGTTSHYGAGLPFDTNGRLVISNNAITRVDQSIPFAANGGVVTSALAVDYVNQGIQYDVNGALVTS